jgi:hypothetical protein
VAAPDGPIRPRVVAPSLYRGSTTGFGPNLSGPRNKSLEPVGGERGWAQGRQYRSCQPVLHPSARPEIARTNRKRPKGRQWPCRVRRTETRKRGATRPYSRDARAGMRPVMDRLDGPRRPGHRHGRVLHLRGAASRNRISAAGATSTARDSPPSSGWSGAAPAEFPAGTQTASRGRRGQRAGDGGKPCLAPLDLPHRPGHGVPVAARRFTTGGSGMRWAALRQPAVVAVNPVLVVKAPCERPEASRWRRKTPATRGRSEVARRHQPLTCEGGLSLAAPLAPGRAAASPLCTPRSTPDSSAPLMPPET